MHYVNVVAKLRYGTPASPEYLICPKQCSQIDPCGGEESGGLAGKPYQAALFLLPKWPPNYRVIQVSLTLNSFTQMFKFPSKRLGDSHLE